VRIALIPTGKLEMLGLAKGLASLFGQAHEFVCLPRTRDRPEEPFNGFTSARLPVASQRERRSSLSNLVAAMVDALWSDRYDLAVVLDDLELCNVGNEAVVIGEFHDAVARHLERVAERDPRLAGELGDRLRACGSFHLVSPMIESWIFADPAGAANAGVPLAHLPPRLRRGCDPECFDTDDLDYSADVGSACAVWLALRSPYQERQRPEWLRPTYPRESHPKRYLAWLCRDPEARNCSSFEERRAADALARLSWAQVLQDPRHMRLARSLICDLADGLGCAPAGVDLTSPQALLTSIDTRRVDPVLRNL
jgi:hypothetical protein